MATGTRKRLLAMRFTPTGKCRKRENGKRFDYKNLNHTTRGLI